ncbi:D-xylose transporter subunit XylF, partial [Shigella flexneri]|nr:D-xylose transporter subunit XylF [Shigella flexneri]
MLKIGYVYRGDCYLLKLSSNYRRPYTMKIKNILLTLCTSLLLTNVAAHAKEV